jgi:transcriptional regulator with XRE-family HTH domain
LVTFAERLKQLRKENGITMEDLAEEIGTTKSTISRYENNKREPKKHFIEKTAEYFNVSTDYLLGLKNEKSSADKIKKAISDDPELHDVWDKISKRENLQLLFKQTKNLDDSSIRQIIRIIKAIEEDEEKRYNGG